jgi:predicted Rossmann-fold nucleotide-binding protein
MSAPKRTKRGRAKRDINDTATELSKTGKVDCLEALLGISIEQYESEQTEEETIRHKKLDDRVEAIRKNPEVFFSLDGGFGDEEICAVRTALQGKNWNEIFLLAVDAEQQKLMNLGYSPAQADALSGVFANRASIDRRVHEVR